MDALRSYLNSFSSDSLLKEIVSGILTLKLDGKDYEMKHKLHLYVNAKDRE